MNRIFVNRYRSLMVMTGVVTLSLVGVPMPSVTGHAVAGMTATEDAEPLPADLKRAALQWLDTYIRDSVLLEPAAVKEIRETVAQMTPSQLDQWLKETKLAQVAATLPPSEDEEYE